ncbi:MAG: MBL fold metallo-hydrolase [Lachnospiraceae bacterium]|nr:MBL fold metallo-hydrolase [Lachnospiraceae bacterium]
MHKIHQIRCKTDNCYIVENGDNAILVDTGTKEWYDTVLNECKKYNMRLIVLTHVHFDHAENASKLSEEFDIPVAFHKSDEELFDNYSAQPLVSYGIVGRVVLGLSLKVLRDTKIQIPKKTVYIDDGDDLNTYGVNARIIGLPGHTKGSVGVDVEDQSLLVGDALDNWISPATGHLYSNLEDLKKSADKIISLGDRTLYYGHGNPTTGRFKLL